MAIKNTKFAVNFLIMKGSITRYLTLLLVLVLLGSCSKFRKVQKSSDWKVKYEAALKYYEKKDYYRASVLLEEILPIIRGTEEAELANYYFAYCYYYQKQYILSAHYFKLFTEVYGRSAYAMESAYMSAYSTYLQSPLPNLDQTTTFEALVALQNFINKYPFSEYSVKADALIDELQVKLEVKAYENAKLYYKLRRYKATLVAIDNFRYDYPDSKFIEELSYLAVETIYLLAKQSIYSKQEERFRETLTRYTFLVDRYPQSKYLKEAEKYYTDSMEQLTIFADQKSIEVKN